MFKRLVLTLLILSTLTAAQAAAQYSFLPIYWINGQVQNSADGVSKAEGRTVIFYDKSQPGLGRAETTVVSGKFMLNAFEAYALGIEVGKTYDVAVIQDGNGYGAEATITISGYGFDSLSQPLVLAAGAGAPPTYANQGTLAGTVKDTSGNPVAGAAVTIEGTALHTITATSGAYTISGIDPGTYSVSAGKQYYITKTTPDISIAAGATTTVNFTIEKIKETPPRFVKIMFGNRLYQKAMVAKGVAFVVSPTPKISVNIEGRNEFGINSASFSIIKDEGKAASYTYNVATAKVSAQTTAAGMVHTMDVVFEIPEDKPIAELAGEETHTLTFKVSSAGLKGTVSSTEEVAVLTVMGGPARLIGTPIAFPSPFSITKQGTVTVQYQLSRDTAIQIILVDISGQRIRNFIFEAGQEGGSAGINKVTWDGRTDRGTLAGNGIYLGTIIARDEARRLGSVKLTIVD